MGGAFAGFDHYYFFEQGCGHHVYCLEADNQPGVLIIQELPGIFYQTIDFAKRLHRDGYNVYLPHLFGTPDVKPDKMLVPLLKNTFKVCVSREFKALAKNEDRPITQWLQALSRDIAGRTGGPIAAIGMCYSGSFVLALMLDDSVAAPVMSQPAGFGNPFTRDYAQTLSVSDEVVSEAVDRSEQQDIPVMGFRFTHDALCPKARFDYLADLFGDRFQRFEIDSSLFNNHRIPLTAHSVFTADYVDKPNHPTYNAYQTLTAFLDERLAVA